MLQRSTHDMYLISESRSENFGSRVATSPDVRLGRWEVAMSIRRCPSCQSIA